MDIFKIDGGTRLRGEVSVNGAKNAALPILAASLLTTDEVIIRGVPLLTDVTNMLGVLRQLGADAEQDGNGDIRIQVKDEGKSLAPYDVVRKMRASISVLGPLVARRGKAEVSMPGGCAIGDRPVDLHLRGLRALGTRLELRGGNIVAECERLQGTELFMGGPFGSTVLGTANILCAACLAEGTTMIESAACEPEIVDLGDCLNAMGAKVRGHGSPTIWVEGVDELHGVDYRIIPDRIETGTLMVAAAITNGELLIKGGRADHLMAFIDRLRLVGVTVDVCEAGLRVSSSRRLEPVDVTTQPYPGFPTDLQAQLMALLCLADGNSIVTEKIYPDRFMHVPEMNRMGADLRKEGPTVIVAGVRELVAAPVMASDLRASAALVLAGLAARGETVINRVYHIDRGYERLEEKLNAVGARIRREQV